MKTMTTSSDRAERQRAVREALPEHLDRLTWSTVRIVQHQEEQLRSLLRIARERSPFHAERLGDIDVDHFILDDLADLPTMTKAEMMARFDDLVTDRRVTKAAVEEHLATTGFEASELFGEHLVLASGGSSGQRGLFVYPRANAVASLLALTRPGLARTVAMLGEIPSEPLPVATVAAGSGVHATRAFGSLFGGDLMVANSIPATDPIETIVARLEEVQPLLLQGYPSVIRRLADEKLAGRLDIAPLSVSTTSEPLSSDSRVRIDEAFGVGVCDMFGSSEGVFGVSPPDDPAIKLASDLAIVELVDDDNQPVAPGMPSSKVLVTNLNNPLQPLIRYELTDAFVAHPASAEDGHVRVSVEGRSDDELRYPNGVVVHPLAVRTVMVKTSEATEYQVRQTGDGVDIAVVASGPLDTEQVRAEVASQLAMAGLAEPSVSVRAVAPHEIERHPDTGKTRRFIPLPP